MSITDLIRHKRDGAELGPDDIERIVAGATDGSIPDYQLSAFLMAVYFAGMTPAETAHLTLAMAASGRRLDLSSIDAAAVDKHSTGGVGDKVSLILAPIVASCGIAVPMISGRGLGHTGGTVDKLEAIPGFRTNLGIEEVERQVASIGLAMAAQTDDLAPADRTLYALRDVTATVESLPLITASILSKKLAEDLDALVMDVKVGTGAFMRTNDAAEALAGSIARTAEAAGLRCSTFITRMDAPLGRRIGNWHEVCESVRVLRGQEEPPLLMDVTLTLAGAAIHAGGGADSLADGIDRARAAISSGAAYELFLRLVERQGGEVGMVERAEEPAPSEIVMAESSGYVTAIDSFRLGLLAIELGAGRRTLDDAIDPHAGIVIHHHLGDPVHRGDPLCSLVERRPGQKVDPAELRRCFAIAEAPLTAMPAMIVRTA